jgi:hypothetical protein
MLKCCVTGCLIGRLLRSVNVDGVQVLWYMSTEQGGGGPPGAVTCKV